MRAQKLSNIRYLPETSRIMSRSLPAYSRPALSRFSPGAVLVALILAGFFLCALVLLGALRTPWLGLTLAADGGEIRIQRTTGPAAQVPAPARLVAVGSPHGALEPVFGGDLLEDPSMLASYAAQNAFLARQGLLAPLLAGNAVQLQIEDPTGLRTYVVEPAAARPVASLPVMFWVQLAAGLSGLLIGAWVWVLRPADWGARMFGCTGAMMLGFALPAAWYSTRELALPVETFQALSVINMAGALAFGCALIAIFLCFPRQLVSPSRLLVIPVVFGTVLAGDVLQFWPAPLAGPGTLLQTLIAIGCIAVQWRAARGDPQARAALRWLGLAAIIGAALFVVPQVMAPLLGGLPPLPQGYGFVSFLIMYAGMALGISRYRLFQLDEWAFRILLWIAGVVALLLIDAVLIWLLHLAPAVSLGLAAIVVGSVYLPLRNQLWQRIMSRRSMSQDELFRGVLDVALEQLPSQRAQAWQHLLTQTYRPLEILPGIPPAREDCQLADNGLTLHVPAVAHSHALTLRYPWQGRGLFGPAQLRLAQRLVALLRYADASQDSFMQGVAQERQRIMRDLHDDVGARLISGLHQTDDGELRQTLRSVLRDLRTVLSGMAGEPLELDQLLAELQGEAAERLAAAGIGFSWHAPAQNVAALPLNYDTYKNLMSAQREVVSNVLRHARADQVSVTVEVSASRLAIATIDSRTAVPSPPLPARGAGHRGMENIRHRLERLGGRASFERHGQGSTTVLSIPLPAPASAAVREAP